jgi:hypothetical protein
MGTLGVQRLFDVVEGKYLDSISAGITNCLEVSYKSEMYY